LDGALHGIGSARQPEVSNDGAILPPGPALRITLLLFRSPWMTPLRCASASPAHNWDASFRASPCGTGPRAPLGQGLSIEELHGEEVDFALRRGSGVNLEDFADIGVADGSGVAHFRRKAMAEAGPRTLEGDPSVQPLVHGFVHDAHAAAGHLAHNAEAVFQQISRFKRASANSARFITSSSFWAWSGILCF
jgi:hypothetical protein